MSRKLLVPAVVLASVSILALTFAQQSISSQVMRVEANAFTYPSGSIPSVQDVTAYHTARINGTSLPVGWTVGAMEGKVTVTDTGHIMESSGERSWTASIVDNQVDLDSAHVYINSQLVLSATRANGMIIDRSGMSIANLSVLVPPASQAWTGRLEWIGANGYVRSYELAQP